MKLLQIDAEGPVPRVHASAQPLASTVAHALRMTQGPVTLMVHGYKYAPGAGAACPHKSLFCLTHDPASATANPKVISWPRHLNAPGLILCFGWHARGPLWRAYQRACEAGQALAEVLRLVHRLAPERACHVLGHSLGARVGLQALPHIPAGAVHSMILMAAAEYHSTAQKALDSAAGRTAQVLHVTSGENDLYDFLFERLVAPEKRGDRSVGATPLGHACTLMLDDPDMLHGLERLGLRIAPATRRVCHWSPYLRDGIFDLYRALITDDLSHKDLHRVLTGTSHRRWSRLLPRLRAPGPLSLPQDAST